MNTDELIAVLDERKEAIQRFKEGDVLFKITNSKYNLYKILRIDEIGYHIKSFIPQSEIPSTGNLNDLEIHNPHFTIKNLKGLKWLYHQSVDPMELAPYLEQLRENDFEGWLEATGKDIEQVIEEASEIFFEGNKLVEQNNHDEALILYDKAIEILPIFYEAMDNKGFVKMATGKYSDAINDFNSSLEIEPENFNAVCAIGECYYEMDDIETALLYFENAHHIDPENQLPVQFIQKIQAENEEAIEAQTQPAHIIEDAVKIATESQQKQIERSAKQKKQWNWKFW